MRAVTYYLDVSSDCARRVVAVEGALAAICKRIEAADLTQRRRGDGARDRARRRAPPPSRASTAPPDMR